MDLKQYQITGISIKDLSGEVKQRVEDAVCDCLKEKGIDYTDESIDKVINKTAGEINYLIILCIQQKSEKARKGLLRKIKESLDIEYDDYFYK